MEQTKYDVFISYSHKDYVDDQKNEISGNAVTRIKETLKESGISYWFDEEGIYSGNEFTEKIVTNIEASTIFLFLSTKNANSSPWTSKEIACADELQKYIIPVRIDHSPYNKKVLFHLVDKSYINFAANPNEGLREIVNAINKYKEELEENRKKREEEERIRKEKELKKAEQKETRKRKEQESVVSEIKLSCKTLNNKEEILQLDRENLLLITERILDTELRQKIKQEIIDSSPIREKCIMEFNVYKNHVGELERQLNVETTERSKLANQNNNLKNVLERQVKELLSNRAALQKMKEDWDKQIKRNSKLQKKLEEAQKGIVKPSKFLLILCSILFFLLLASVSVMYSFYNSSKSWHKKYALLEITSNDNVQNLTDSIQVLKDVMNQNTHEEKSYCVSGITIQDAKLGSFLYTGMVDSGQVPQGIGYAVFSNNDLYAGSFVDGSFSKGRYVRAEDGTFFEGLFKEGEPDEENGAYYRKGKKTIIKLYESN